MSKSKSKVTVITGGNHGIGFGTAQAFEKEGAVGARQASLSDSEMLTITIFYHHSGANAFNTTFSNG